MQPHIAQAIVRVPELRLQALLAGRRQEEVSLQVFLEFS
ncbi:hypothetical protein C4J98_3078 [Pseudomonas orientalis]|nr:hypothetical protein C4J98_3078 [Pseudomonas orientalis]